MPTTEDAATAWAKLLDEVEQGGSSQPTTAKQTPPAIPQKDTTKPTSQKPPKASSEKSIGASISEALGNAQIGGPETHKTAGSSEKTEETEAKRSEVSEAQAGTKKYYAVVILAVVGAAVALLVWLTMSVRNDKDIVATATLSTTTATRPAFRGPRLTAFIPRTETGTWYVEASPEKPYLYKVPRCLEYLASVESPSGVILTGETKRVGPDSKPEEILLRPSAPALLSIVQRDAGLRLVIKDGRPTACVPK